MRKTVQGVVDPASRTGVRLRGKAVQQRLALGHPYKRRHHVIPPGINTQVIIVKRYWASKKHHCWVVAQEVGGVPIRYFRFDYNKGWGWTRSLSKATKFVSKNSALREITFTSMPDRHVYNLRKVPVR